MIAWRSNPNVEIGFLLTKKILGKQYWRNFW